MTTFDADQGRAFGLWPNATARLIYHDVMPTLLSGVDTSGRVADYGGANGLLKQWIPQSVSIDVDPTKAPDVYDDVLTHTGAYDLVVMRYLLHYLDEFQALALFKHLASFHTGRILVIQFVNDRDMIGKLRNSVNEVKHFRIEAHVRSLAVSQGWDVIDRKLIEYTVGADFYRDRLGNPNGMAHEEAVVGLYLERRQA